MTDLAVRMEFRLMDNGKDGPMYIWQESPALQDGPEWQRVATILENACAVALNDKPVRVGRRWNLGPDRPKLSGIVDFSAMFAAHITTAGFEAVSFRVQPLASDSYVLDMDLDKAIACIERGLSSKATGITIKPRREMDPVVKASIATDTGMPEAWKPSSEDKALEAELAMTPAQREHVEATLQPGSAGAVAEGDSNPNGGSYVPGAEQITFAVSHSSATSAAIHGIRERLRRNQISDGAAIRQLVDVVDSLECWFSRDAFKALVAQVEE